jgi:hypothetical protein
MKVITYVKLTQEQFEAVLYYILSFSAYQITKGIASLSHARKRWDEIERLGVPMKTRNEIHTLVGKLP